MIVQTTLNIHLRRIIDLLLKIVTNRDINITKNENKTDTKHERE